MGIVFGLLAAIFWGLGDFLITHLTRRVGTSLALVTIQVFSLLGWAMWVIARPSTLEANLALWGIVVATAICHVLGLVFVYRAARLHLAHDEVPDHELPQRPLVAERHDKASSGSDGGSEFESTGVGQTPPSIIGSPVPTTERRRWKG